MVVGRRQGAGETGNGVSQRTERSGQGGCEKGEEGAEEDGEDEGGGVHCLCVDVIVLRLCVLVGLFVVRGVVRKWSWEMKWEMHGTYTGGVLWKCGVLFVTEGVYTFGLRITVFCY